MIKFHFQSLPLYIDSLSRRLWVGSPQIPMTVNFYGQKPYRHRIFFIGSCKFFHQFSTKYSLNNNILNFKKFCVWDLPFADLLNNVWPVWKCMKSVWSKFFVGEEGVVDGEGGSSERCLKWGGGVIKGSFQKHLKTGAKVVRRGRGF